MFPTARLKFLQQRKQELLNASEVQRCLLAKEFTEAQQRLEGLDHTITTARRILSWCGLALPLVRLWSSRHGGAGDSWFSKITKMLPIARQFTEVFKVFGQHRD